MAARALDRMTLTTLLVLDALVRLGADEWTYGASVMRQTRLSSGTAYPILARLEAAGWIECSHEDIDPHIAGRPARRNYRLTVDGRQRARVALIARHRQVPDL